MGRRTKCTPELTAKLCEYLMQGNYIDTACKCVGIDQSTYHNWVNRAEDELARRDAGEEPNEREDIFVEFLKLSTRARAESEAVAVAQIRDAAKEDWRANAWFLEHSHRERWGKRSIDVTSGGEKVRGVIVLPDNGRGEE